MTRLIATALFVAVELILPASLSNASESFSVEDYGTLPDIRSMSISPDGKHYAFIKNRDRDDMFVVVNYESGNVVGGASSGNVKAKRIYFATNKHVIIVGSQTKQSSRFNGKWENQAALSYNLETEEVKTLLNGVKRVYPAQSGLGRIVGLNREEEVAYMPARMGQQYPPPNHLMRISLNTGKDRPHAKGTHHTIDWFVDRSGKVLAREDYDEQRKEHRVLHTA